MPGRDDEFTAYVATRGVALRRTAFLLCGDWHRAEDLVQTALIKLYGAWRRVRRADSVDAYTRRILVRVFLDEARKMASREIPADELPDVPAPATSTEDGMDVRAALATVPSRQRATLVLRFWEDLSVEQVAEALACNEGTVKSQTARGLAALRAALARLGGVEPTPAEGTRR